MRIDHDRLNGWKDVAAFLGKGVRTVQRWERDHKLPVHRQGANGDLIFAYRSELEAWVRAGGVRGHDAVGATADSSTTLDAAAQPGASAPPFTAQPTVASPAAATQAAPHRASAPAASQAPAPSPVTRSTPAETADDWGHLAPRRSVAARGDSTMHPASRRRLWPAAALLALASVLAVLPALRQGPQVDAAARQPAKWRIAADTLHVLDADGAPLWSHRFPYAPEHPDFTIQKQLPGTTPVTIADLDQDGQREVVVAPPWPALRDDGAIHVFEADGRPRFQYTPEATVDFGGEAYAGPWLQRRLFVSPAAPGRPPILWVIYTHGMWFPSLLVRLSPQGAIEAEYWSDGFIDLVLVDDWRGAPHVFVGATNNDTRGASLAIFPLGEVRGSAPAERARYRCATCPPGGPAEFVAFPRRCIAAAGDGQPIVWDVWVDDGDRLHVLVAEGQPDPEGARQGAAWYTLGPDLAVEDAEYKTGYVAYHRQQERVGTLDHAYDAHGDADLLPVRRWIDDRFVPVPVRKVVTE